MRGDDHLTQELQAAIATKAFELRYAPQINLRTGLLTSFEALARWNHPLRGAVSPQDFIPLAEATGLIGPLSRHVLGQACWAAAGWPNDIGVAVNVSATQLIDGTLPAMAASALRETGLHPSRLELEITESVFMDNQPGLLRTLQMLRDMGIRTAIDDFGVGYSSFGYLVKFPFDKVKIDRSFVAGLGRVPSYSAIVRAIIGLCAGLGIVCTAEGVETQEQLAFLTHANCTEAQGHLFSQPVLSRDVPPLLRRIKPAGAAPEAAIRQLPVADIPFFQIAETANDIIIVTTADLDPPGPTIVYVNPAFTWLTGYSAAEVIGLSPRILQGPGTSRTSLDAVRAALHEGRVVREKVLNYAKCGAPYWLDLRIVALRDAGGAITHFAAIERDVTMDKRRVDELEFVADRDTLTGMPNRGAFMRAIEAEIEAARRHENNGAGGSGPCLAFIDVDHFKAVNDRYGHSAGDAVLFGVADRLAENLRRPDTLGRIGGEEFAVCMPKVDLHSAKWVAERLRRAVAAEPIATPSGPLPVTVSVGVTPFRPGDSVASMMKRADTAMYAAKRSGRDRVKADSTTTG